MFPSARVHVLIGRQIAPLPAYAALGGWFVLQLANGFGAVAETTQTENGGGIAYAAHIGGFVGGLLLAGAMGAFRRRPAASV
jgi:membrane associated rhomboid family serine protease